MDEIYIRRGQSRSLKTTMRKRIRRSLTLVLLLVLPIQFSTIAQSDLNLTGSWVGVYEAAERVIIFFIEWDENGEGHFYTQQSPRPSLISDLQQETQHIQFMAGTGDNKLLFSGDWVDTAYVGQVNSEIEKGRFYLAPLIDITTDQFDECIGSYEKGADQSILVTRADQANQLFYQDGDRQIRIYPIGKHRFLTALGEQISCHLYHLQRNSLLHPERSDFETTRLTNIYQEELIAFQNKDVTLSGSLLLPSGEKQFPAVILVHGSGAAERHFYRVFADQFARQGIAALIYDKRGHGESTGQKAETTLHNLVNDARAGIQFLAQHEKIDAERIGIWGFSQGGRILPMVAAQNKDIAFAIAVSAPAMTVGMLDAWRQDIIYQENGKSDLVRSSALKMSQLSQSFASWQGLDDDWSLDPIQFWQQITQPVLLIFGSDDRLIPPDDSVGMIVAALGQGAKTKATFTIFSNTNHDIMLVDTAIPTYAPDYFDTMIDWIQNEYIVSSISSPTLQPTGEFAKNGRYAPPSWYGQFLVQFLLIMFTGIVFLSTSIYLLVRYPHKEYISLYRFKFIVSLCGLSQIIIFCWSFSELWQNNQVLRTIWYLQLVSILMTVAIFVYIFKLLQLVFSTHRFIKDHVLFTLATFISLLFILYWNVL